MGIKHLAQAITRGSDLGVGGAAGEKEVFGGPRW